MKNPHVTACLKAVSSRYLWVPMRPSKAPTSSAMRSSNAGLASTASAVVALVAIAALMSSAPRLAMARVAPVEARSSVIAAPSVRAVAAAVAAAARELVGGERINAALPVPRFAEALAAPAGRLIDRSNPDQIIHCRMVSERLIDLPPPSC